ncbi:hypothetical protein KIK04_06880 [Paenibacillus sp. 481]|nr:hypothetical protein KIK04_06880 [Paenibacillus sp. 481]
MDYFLLKQDRRYTNVPVLQEVRQKLDSRHINRLNAHSIADTLMFYVKAEADSSYLDLFDQQLFLMSDQLKRVVELYAPDTIFKLTPLVDHVHHKQHNYVLPIFEEVDALSPSCEFNTDKSVIKKLILLGDALQGKKIVSIKGSSQRLVVVRLDVAESILRRSLVGIQLEKVAIEQMRSSYF